MFSKAIFALLAFITALGFATTGWAEPRRIAVLQPDAELLRAVSLALEPWGIETIATEDPLPKTSQPEASQEASHWARRLDVEALVWVTTLEEGTLLWVFDARTEDVTTRRVPQMPPFDGAAAAAVALSVKTVLRASFVAPPQERFGAQPAEPEPELKPEPSVSPPKERSTAFEFGSTMHWLSDRTLDFRFNLAAVLWIPTIRRLGFGLRLSSGPGIAIDSATYEGHYREFVTGGEIRLRLVDLPRFSTVLTLGGAAHFSSLEGTLIADSIDQEVSRENGSFDFDVRVNFFVTRRLYFGASIGAAYFPTYQRYLVNGSPVFAPWPVSPNLTVYAGVELF
jgi:hypothetical protein